MSQMVVKREPTEMSPFAFSAPGPETPKPAPLSHDTTSSVSHVTLFETSADDITPPKSAEPLKPLSRSDSRTLSRQMTASIAPQDQPSNYMPPGPMVERQHENHISAMDFPQISDMEVDSRAVASLVAQIESAEQEHEREQYNSVEDHVMVHQLAHEHEHDHENDTGSVSGLSEQPMAEFVTIYEHQSSAGEELMEFLDVARLDRGRSMSPSHSNSNHFRHSKQSTPDPFGGSPDTRSYANTSFVDPHMQQPEAALLGRIADLENKLRASQGHCVQLAALLTQSRTEAMAWKQSSAFYQDRCAQVTAVRMQPGQGSPMLSGQLPVLSGPPCAIQAKPNGHEKQQSAPARTTSQPLPKPAMIAKPEPPSNQRRVTPPGYAQARHMAEIAGQRSMMPQIGGGQ
jgi:hypothetical protein